ncbi:MAG: aerobic carbon-monoxide dehydrogenase large subunit [Hyphomicrobiales bacterium]|nr:aerobic carbon-monoxide dehydrogenase large subunit [Hyphomicrobiales bacterium]
MRAPAVADRNETMHRQNQPSPAKFGIGQHVRRVEDRRFVTGHGSYVADTVIPGECVGILVASQHAHARVVRTDIEAAKAADGVVCILTADDLAADGVGGLLPMIMPPGMSGPSTVSPVLVRERVRYVGDPLVFVVAETALQARHAADLVEVEYEALPATVHVEDALREGAPILWDVCPNNIAFELAHGDPEETTRAFARATHVVSLKVVNNRVSANPIEPRAAIGHFNLADERYTLHTNSQWPHGVRATLANDVFGQSESNFRIISPDVGGGFGMKAQAYAEDALVLLASRRCGRPVKWLSTRSEALMRDTHGRDQVMIGELALDAEGRVLALRARGLHAVGAYVFAAVLAPLEYSIKVLPSVYDIKTVDVRTRGVFTNTSPLSAYRGAGRPEANYMIERLLDHAAAQLKMDPLELRRRNLITPQAFPYETATHYKYDSGEFARLLDRSLEIADWEHFGNRRAASEARGLLRGCAAVFCLEAAGLLNEAMEIRFDPSGTATILAGTHSHGQGHETAYKQMVSEWLGIPFESIRFVQGDTDQVTIGRGTYAARSAVAGGNSLKRAAETIIEKARGMAAEMLEVRVADIEFDAGTFRVTGTDLMISMPEVAKACCNMRALPPDQVVGLAATGSFGFEVPTFPNGCQVCEVEVDPATGLVCVDRLIAVSDVGRLVNPLLAEGQIHGGLAQGIGQALMESVVYERDTGQLITGSFTDYAMPRAADLPNFSTDFIEVPCLTNALGLKGCGELGTVGSPPAMITALLDALRPLGVTDIEMPATPARVWETIQLARKTG